MKLKSICLLVIFVGLMSCSDDESTNDTPLLTVTAAAGSRPDETWIFLTREDGTLIEAKEITGDGVDVVFERPQGFKDERFVVHQMIRPSFNSRGFIIESYTGITGGERSFNPINPGTGITEVARCNYSFTNAQSGYSPAMSGPKVVGYSGSSGSGTCSGTVSLGENNIDLLCWFQKNNNPLAVPKYTIVNASDGETLSMSFNDLIPASEQPFTFGVKQDFATVYLAPDSPELPPMPLYSVLTWSDATEIKLYHPGDVFDAYFTFIETRAGNDYQQYMTTGSLPTSFKSIPATITSLSQEATRVKVTTSGAYDYMIASAYNRWTDNAQEYTISWYVFMDDTATKTFTIPEFPEVIIARHPELSSAPLTGFNSVEIRDHSSFENYPDFISGTWNTVAFPPDTETLSRRKRFTE